MWQYNYTDELKHHGILGMKWGVRRYRNKDGSLTVKGRQRYGDNYTPNNNQTVKTKTKSLHRINLEDKYQKQGMSKEEAEQAAAKIIRAEKFVAVVAVATVIAAVAYKKHVDNGRDFVISKETDLQRIIRLDKDGDLYKGNREYVSYKKMDNRKYEGMMGKFEGSNAKAMNKGIDELHREYDGTDVKITQKYQEMYKLKITPKQDIKVASVNRAKDTFINLYKNDAEFKKSYDEYMTNISKNSSAHGSFKKFAKAIGKGEVNDNFLKSVGYKSFNVSVAETDDKAKAIQNKFYEALKKQGMNAVVDMYDKTGPIKSKAPIITFDGDYDYSKTVLTDKKINKSMAMSVPVLLAQNLAKPAAMAFVAGYSANRVTKSKKANAFIQQYKREHPNTELTDKDILRFYDSKSG